MKRVVVTGANGFIGRSLIRRLIEKRVEVIAVDLSFDESSFPESPFVTKVITSIDEHLTEKIPLSIYDAFYHFAWRGVNGPDKTSPQIQLENIQMAFHCAEACHQLGCAKFLAAGTVAENAVLSLPFLTQTNAGMMYGMAKHSCHVMLETYCKNIGLPFVWMQFSNIYGPGNLTGNLISYTLTALCRNQEATFGPALQPYDFIYVDDLLEAIIRIGAKKTSHSTYFIGSGTPHILREYLVRVGELTSCPEKIRFNVRPDDGVRYELSMFDTTPLRLDIGEYVSHTFDEGVVKTYQWLKNAGG